eukprot:scaffold15422_cov107-Isochrysis_galbana.AAC.3
MLKFEAHHPSRIILSPTPPPSPRVNQSPHARPSWDLLNLTLRRTQGSAAAALPPPHPAHTRDCTGLTGLAQASAKLSSRSSVSRKSACSASTYRSPHSARLLVLPVLPTSTCVMAWSI